MTSQLSHRGRLPSWNRPGLCRKSGADVRKLARDQLPPIALQTSTTSAPAGPGVGKDEAQANSIALARIVQVEKNILFLKQQHHDTLEQLHKEIEWLRNENRELNFKLVMCSCGGTKGRVAGHLLVKETSDVESGTSNDELRVLFQEEEVRELKNRLALERAKSNRLMRIIEKKVLERQKSSSDHSYVESPGGVQQSIREYSLLPVGAGAHPTLGECELVIQQLKAKSSQQEHELLQIKADLRDVLYSHKWTPDAFLMARAYVSADSGFLPQIVSQSSRETLEKAYQRVKEEVTLPALRPKVPSMVAERYRRAQAIRGRVTK